MNKRDEIEFEPLQRLFSIGRRKIMLLPFEPPCASCNAGAWPNGDPILFEASIDGDLDLIEGE